jgi:GAF domain-containing protein
VERGRFEENDIALARLLVTHLAQALERRRGPAVDAGAQS